MPPHFPLTLVPPHRLSSSPPPSLSLCPVALQRDCRLRLREQEMLCPEEREFMFQWNLFLHKHPLHADADLPAALRRFAGEQAGQLARDGPFRRCLLAYLITLWRFRLLTPQQMHELARGLPALA